MLLRILTVHCCIVCVLCVCACVRACVVCLFLSYCTCRSEVMPSALALRPFNFSLVSLQGVCVFAAFSTFSTPEYIRLKQFMLPFLPGSCDKKSAFYFFPKYLSLFFCREEESHRWSEQLLKAEEQLRATATARDTCQAQLKVSSKLKSVTMDFFCYHLHSWLLKAMVLRC